MMFGTIVVSGLQMIGKCGFSSRNITIVALSLGVGLGFTQVPEMFMIFPEIVRTIFAENCVAVVFVMSILLNLILPKEKLQPALEESAETESQTLTAEETSEGGQEQPSEPTEEVA